MEVCPILFGVDENYVDPLLVTMTSLVVDGGASAANAVFSVIHCGLSDAAVARIRRVAAALGIEVEITYLEPVVDEYPVTDWITAASYLRLRVSEVMPDRDRALYLDCDIVTVGDISELLTLLPDAPLAAVRDLSHPLVGCGNGLPGYAKLGLPGDREYFNAGMIVINLQRWQGESVSERASRFLIDKVEHVRLWDQDALNVVLDDGWQRLPAELNAIVMSPLMPMLEKGYLGGDVMSLADALAIEKRAKVLHYAGPFKPWNRPYPECEVGEIYGRYQRELRTIEGERT